MEEREDQAGDYKIENTARWIYREACLKHNADSSTWWAWARMEERENQIGDYNSENTARWIISEGIKRFPEAAFLYLLSSYLELSMRSVETARRILRQSIQYSDFCVGRLAILEFFCGNIDTEDIFCTNNLIKRMEGEVQYSISTLLYLYHCCVLLGRTKDADKYYRKLLQRPEYKPSDTKAEEFIQLCQNALK